MADTPLGVKNRNLLNIKETGNPNDPWKGQRTVDDRGHAIFVYEAYGIRAAIKTIRNIAEYASEPTLGDMIAIWAPVDDPDPLAYNNPNEYAAFVSSKSGWATDTPMRQFFRNGTAGGHIAGVLMAMAVFECGVGTFDIDAVTRYIEDGIAMFNEDFGGEG